MGAAIWSSDSINILDFPAKSFLKFFSNHGLTQISNRPEWRTVVNGSREYVQKIADQLRYPIHTSNLVMTVRQKAGGASLVLKDQVLDFDDVIFACHSDQALGLIENPSQTYLDIFSDLEYRPNKVVLHTDINHLPKRRKAWASWNYIEHLEGEHADPAISYWMNLLQPLPVETPVIVTLNPVQDINEDKILGRYDYEHPVMDAKAMKARAKVWDIQGQNSLWFCGAYLGDGFHEDGIQSGLAVAEMLGGVRRPWLKPGQNARIGFGDLINLNMKASV